MKRWKIYYFGLLVAIVFLFAGCQLYMTPDYQAKVQSSADALDAMVRGCPDPNATPADYCAALAEASRTLHLILDESYGRRP